MAHSFLVFGGSSFVGRHLFETQNTADSIVATYCANPFPGMVEFDSHRDRVDALINPGDDIEHAVLLLGDTQPDSCFADPVRSQRLNVESIINLLDQLFELNIRPVFASSEFVFDGDNGGYVETDEAEPILLYGAQKLEVERYIENHCDDFTILRLAKIYGFTPGDGTLFTGMLEMVQARAEAPCATDQRFSPVWVGDVVSAVMASMNDRLTGTYHVAGPVGLSRMELLELLLAEARLHRDLAFSPKPCSIHDFDLPEKRPLDVSMRADKLVDASGIALMHPGEACRRICNDAFADQ